MAWQSKPWKCGSCRRTLLLGLVDGTAERVVLDAEETPRGPYEYVRGDAQHPVVRELTEDQLLQPADGPRYRKHVDAVDPDRLTVAAGADR